MAWPLDISPPLASLRIPSLCSTPLVILAIIEVLVGVEESVRVHLNTLADPVWRVPDVKSDVVARGGCAGRVKESMTSLDVTRACDETPMRRSPLVCHGNCQVGSMDSPDTSDKVSWT
mmetsp:Transcript_79886/g.216419  ORF Transcript_79886/g.216419 Transcript_79886/m.216419 type:complete len:118 (-) Transcript_79886:266-619(-)